jgi:hypothetical protein
MLSTIKSLLRKSTSASSVNSLLSDGSPATPSLADADQFPFPTNPALVKKFRHNSCPKHLPNPEARINDVRYFLFILLTSKSNDCAKHYPEWVLETCLAWKGGGLQFLKCTEEQLEDLCPMTAAVGFDSHKHKIGTHISFPARQEIGETIAKFVLEKREGEKRPPMIQRRLQEKRSRPPSLWEASNISVVASRPLSSSCSVTLPRDHYARTGSSSRSTRSVRRRIDILPPILSSVALSESPTTIPTSLDKPSILASSVPPSGPATRGSFRLDVDITEDTASDLATELPGSTHQKFSSTPIAASMSRSLSTSRLNAVRHDEEQNPARLGSNLISTEQTARFTNREPGVNLFSQHTMPTAYRAPDPGVKAEGSGSLPSAERPNMTQKKKTHSKESAESNMRHDSGVDNSSQLSLHSTYCHASSAISSSNLKNPTNFDTVNYDLYKPCRIPGSNTMRTLPSGILRTTATDSRSCPSPESSLSKSSTPATSVTPERRVTFVPSRYRELSCRGRLRFALENHYQNLEQLRNASSWRNIHRAATMRSQRSTGTLHSSHNSMHNPYSGQSPGARGPPPPFIRQESASTQRKPSVHQRE